MTLFIVAFSILHVGVFFYLYVSWNRIKEGQSVADVPSGVTVIIPTRNEAENLPVLFDALSKQDLDNLTVQFLFVDDHSEDSSFELISKFQQSSELNIELIELPPGSEGKKAASTYGVNHARHEIILCTDADTYPSSRWIKTMVGMMQKDGLQMATGPVLMSAKGIFQRLQSIEFSGLIGYGASLLHRGVPAMCNGANMAYRKEAFLLVEGYAGNEHIASGDDEFLLQKIAKKFPGKVSFVKNRESIVQTDAKDQLSELLNQRTRWTGKWKAHQSFWIRFSAIMAFLDALAGLMLFFLLFVNVLWALLLIIFRIFAEGLYLGKIYRFFDRRLRLVDLLLISAIYPLYVFILGFASVFGRYNWKGRVYKQAK
jgi:cellulose synthase/poly-beta-1,6-N-acetylglucosamine synthase-like glycosyltransferase